MKVTGCKSGLSGTGLGEKMKKERGRELTTIFMPH